VLETQRSAPHLLRGLGKLGSIFASFRKWRLSVAISRSVPRSSAKPRGFED